MAELESFAIRLGVEGADEARGKLDKLGGSMNNAERDSSALDVAVGNLAANLAGALVDAVKDGIKWLADLVPAFAELGDEVGKTTKALGVDTPEALQRLRYAGERSGVPIEKLDDSLGKLTKQLEDARLTGAGPMAEAMKTLGLELDEVAQLGTEEQVGLIADALAEIPDKQQRAAISMQIFGDGNKRMGVLLAEGSAGITALGDRAEDLGSVLSGEAVAGAEQLADQMLDLDRTVGGLKASIASGLAPAYGALVEGATAWIDSNRELLSQGIETVIDLVTGAAEALAPALDAVVELAAVLLPELQHVADVLMPVIDAVAALVVELVEGLSPSIADLLESLDPLIDIIGDRLLVAVESLGPAVEGLIAVFEVITGVITVWIDVAVDAYNAAVALGDYVQTEWPEAWGVATRVVDTAADAMDAARGVVVKTFDWLEKAVSKVGYLADKVREVRKALGLGTGESGSVVGAATGTKIKATTPPAKGEPPGKPSGGPSWNSPEAKAERSRRRAEAEATRAKAAAERERKGSKGGGGGGRAKPSSSPGGASGIDDLLGVAGTSIPDVLGGGRAPGPSLIRVDASYHAPTTIHVEIHGVDTNDAASVDRARREIAGELAADLAERDRRAFERYAKILV